MSNVLCSTPFWSTARYWVSTQYTHTHTCRNTSITKCWMHTTDRINTWTLKLMGHQHLHEQWHPHTHVHTHTRTCTRAHAHTHAPPACLIPQDVFLLLLFCPLNSHKQSHYTVFPHLLTSVWICFLSEAAPSLPPSLPPSLSPYFLSSVATAGQWKPETLHPLCCWVPYTWGLYYEASSAYPGYLSLI